MKLMCDTVPTPIGDMTAVFSDDALCMLDFSENAPHIEKRLKRRFDGSPKTFVRNFMTIRDRLSAYFAGYADAFAGLKLDPGGTSFQQTVWRGLSDIPYGCTLSYRELAHTIDKPKAWRAVGTANGRNPIAIIIPCHRVIASNGTLSGYAGGAERKRTLLRLEGALNEPAEAQNYG